MYTTLSDRNDVDATVDFFGISDYQGFAVFARESTTSYWNTCDPFNPTVLAAMNTKKFEEELQKALTLVGLDGLGLKGEWLVITSYS